MSSNEAKWYCPNVNCMGSYIHGRRGSRVFFTVDLRTMEALRMQNINVEVNKLPMTMYLVNLDPETDNIISCSSLLTCAANSRMQKAMKGR